MPHPVPRERIPWFPTIDAGLCDGCGVCLDFCRQRVFAREETDGRVRVRVVQPYGCVVGCNGCESLCPKRALSFPDIDAVQVIIRKLREEGES